jgi:hypothetical protein
MDVYLDDKYPADAAYGADFLSRAAQGEVRIDTPNGPILRQERIIISSAEVDYEGRVCFGERTIRHLAHQLDLVDRWRVELIEAQRDQYLSDLVECSHELAETLEQNRRLRELEDRPAERVYLSLGGVVHANARAAMEASRLELQILRPHVPPTADQPQEVTA